MSLADKLYKYTVYQEGFRDGKAGRNEEPRIVVSAYYYLTRCPGMRELDQAEQEY